MIMSINSVKTVYISVFSCQKPYFIVNLINLLGYFIRSPKIVDFGLSEIYLLTVDTIFEVVRKLLIRLLFFLTKISIHFVEFSTSNLLQ